MTDHEKSIAGRELCRLAAEKELLARCLWSITHDFEIDLFTEDEWKMAMDICARSAAAEVN